MIMALHAERRRLSEAVAHDDLTTGDTPADPSDRHPRSARQLFYARPARSPRTEQELVILTAAQRVAGAVFAGERAIGTRKRQIIAQNHRARTAGPANMPKVLEQPVAYVDHSGGKMRFSDQNTGNNSWSWTSMAQKQMSGGFFPDDAPAAPQQF